MIALWMGYAALVALLAGLGAAAVERLLRLWHRPVRLVWALALGASMLAPPLLLVLPLVRPPGDGAVVAGPVVALGIADVGAEAAPGLLARVQALAVGALGGAAERLAALDAGLLVAWAVLSGAALVALLTSALRLRRHRRAWRATTVDGTPVLVAPDAGPAVMGSGEHRIVLPSWALALDAPLRALVLRHEAEHLRAGDPRLLLAGVLALVLTPWSPAVWWQVRRLRLAVELDCDRRVLAAGGDVERYGLLLLAVSQRGGGMLRLAMPALSEGATDLERRIAAMTAPAPRRRLARAAALLATAGAVVAVACVVPSPNTVSGPAAPGEPQPRRDVPPEPAVTQPGQTFFEFQVEAPVQRANAVSPAYPADLRAAGVSGQVIAQFVVDTTGRADVSTFKAIESSDPRFTAAVLDALPTMQFTPALVGGRKVKQLVQQAFAFAVPTPAGPPDAPPPAGTAVPTSRTAISPRAVSTVAAPRPDTSRTVEPTPAQQLNAVTPAYPAELRAGKVSGSVTVMVVVDSTGALEMSSLKVVRSDHPLFTAAVRTALPGLRYRPAMVGSRAVRQLVRHEFTFRAQ